MGTIYACFLGLLLSAQAYADLPALSPEVRHRADQMISVFENEELSPQYDYVENLDDGRGYTAGRVGFCTGTGDLLLVVERYTAQTPNPLARFLPRLRELASEHSDSVAGLGGFVEAWKKSAQDTLFRQAQDEMVDTLYFRFAQNRAQQIGAALPLTLVALYEAIIQHGDDGDPDSLGAIMERASQKVGGNPAHGVSEIVWLEAFLKERRADLLHSYDSSTREVWRKSVGRADDVLRIFYARNYDFHGPIQLNPYGTTFLLP